MAKPTDLRQAILGQADGPARTADNARPDSEPTTRPGPANRQPGRTSKVSIAGYFRPEVRRQLRRLPADGDTTVQALLGEALNDLFAKRGAPELVERD